MLESLHAYTIMTNVVSKNGLLNRKQFVAAGFLLPAICTGITAAINFENYRSWFSCWTNFGHSVGMGTIIPVATFSAIAIIASEAASIEEAESLPNCNKSQKIAASVNQKSVIIILLANIAAWFLGAFAVFYAKVYLYTGVFIANVCLAIAIFIFHIMGNPRANQLIRALLARLCNRG